MRCNLLGFIFTFIGLFFLINFQFNITGAAIGTYDISPTVNSMFGLIFLIFGLILFTVNKDEDLETKIKKLFVKDKKTGMIRFIDEDYFLSQELGYSLQSKSADEILTDLKNEFGSDAEIKNFFQQYLARTNVFKSAYNQRDICKNLKPGTEGYYADNFLREWDSNYKEFIPHPNPYLTYEEGHNATKVFESNLYDTREILPLIEKNIDGFHILDKRIGSHDVHVEYCGAKFQVMAGSHHPYEIPYANIIKLLKRR